MSGELSVDDVMERAELLDDFGKLDQAREELIRGLAVHTDSAVLWGARAWVEVRLRPGDAVAESAYQALAHDPFQHAAWMALTVNALKLGDVEESLSRSATMLLHWPNEAVPHLYRAAALKLTDTGKKGADRDELREHVHEALALDPENVSHIKFALDLLAGIAGRRDRLHLVRQGLVNAPEDADLQFRLAQLEARTDSGMAGDLASVLRAAPQHEDAQLIVETVVWQRVGHLAALAAWAVPAVAVPPVLFGLIIRAVINGVHVARLALGGSGGILWRTLSRVRGARLGFVLACVSAPSLVWFVLSIAGVWPLLVAPWMLLVAEILLVRGEHVADRRRIAQWRFNAGESEEDREWAASRATALAQITWRLSRRGWFRIVVGLAASVVATVLLATLAGDDAPTQMRVGLGLVGVACALAVPAAVRMVFAHLLVRSVPHGSNSEV